MDDRLLAIFRETFNDENLNVDETTTPADVERWDSFGHMILVMRIEEEFGVSFSTTEIADMTRVGEIVRLIADKRK